MTDSDVGDSGEPGRSQPGSRAPECFEDRLLSELKTFAVGHAQQARVAVAVADPPRRRRKPLVAAAAAALLAAGGAVIVPSVLPGGHGARSAYAVQRQGNGKVSLEINGVIATPQAVQRDLASAGAPVTVVPAGPCRSARRPIAAPAGLLSRTGPKTFVIDPHKIPRGTRLIAQVPIRGHAGPLRLSLSVDAAPRC